MAQSNYIRQQITRQLANRSGTLSIANNQGGYQYIDANTGAQVAGPSVSSTYLSNPPRATDPRISAAAVNEATGNIIGNNIPEQLVSALASVAAYIGAVNGVSVQTLFQNNSPTLQLIAGYNTFKPKGSQLGIFEVATITVWQSNPTLRGSVLLTQ